MVGVLSSPFPVQRIVTEVCAHIPVAVGVGVGRSAPSQPAPRLVCTPSAAYPLSPRRREIARGQTPSAVNNEPRPTRTLDAQPSIRDRPQADVASKQNAKEAAIQNTDGRRWGRRPARVRGRPPKSSTSTGPGLDQTPTRAAGPGCRNVFRPAALQRQAVALAGAPQRG